MKKVYLETPEAVIKALKEGKEIRSKNENSYRLIDGFIVGNGKYVNCCIDCEKDRGLYILEEEPLEIKVGEFYETRSNEKARCYTKGEECAFLTIDNDPNPFGVYINGHYTNSNAEHPLDIIGPWKGE